MTRDLSGTRWRLSPLTLALCLSSLALAYGCGKDDPGGGTDPPVGDPRTLTGTLQYEVRLAGVVNKQIKLSNTSVFPGLGLDIYVADSAGAIIGKTQVTDGNGKFSVKLSRDLKPGSDVLFIPAIYAPTVGGQEKLLLAVLKPTSGGTPMKNLSLNAWVWSSVPSGPNLGTLTITEASGSGAVFAYLVNLAAMQEVISSVPQGVSKVKSLAILWAPGVSWSCGACYSNEATQSIATGGTLQQSIFLSGSSTGSSAWGYPTLLHEFGHSVASNYSRDDSPGGAHSLGQVITPPFAWSEGWATFFSMSVMSVWMEEAYTIYWDIQQGSSFWVDIEDASSSAGNLTHPNPSGSMSQSLDENYVSSMIWHLWDGKEIPEPSGDNDGTALGSDQVLKAIMSNRFLSYNRGATGADFVDFVDAALCNNKGLVSAVTKTVKSYLGFPYDGQPGCP